MPSVSVSENCGRAASGLRGRSEATGAVRGIRYEFSRRRGAGLEGTRKLCVEVRGGSERVGNAGEYKREGKRGRDYEKRIRRGQSRRANLGGSRSSLSSLACPAPPEPCTALCASLPSPPRLPLYAHPCPPRARALVAEIECARDAALTSSHPPRPQRPALARSYATAKPGESHCSLSSE